MNVFIFMLVCCRPICVLCLHSCYCVECLCVCECVYIHVSLMQVYVCECVDIHVSVL